MKILQWNDKHFPDWKQTEPIFYSNALAGEVGEICNLVKKMYGGGTKQNGFSRFSLGTELADILIYLVLLSESLNISLADFDAYFEEKLKIITKRMERGK